MKLYAHWYVKKFQITGDKTRDRLFIEVNGEMISCFYALEYNKPNTDEQIEFVKAIVDAINAKQPQETAKLFIELER